MAKPNKNSTRQKILGLNLGEQIDFPRENIKVSSLSSTIASIQQDIKKKYSYRTGDEFITVTRVE